MSIGFIITRGTLTDSDLLALVLYAGLAAFAWHPMTAAFVVMLVTAFGVVFTGSGGDLLELAIALSLVAATCAPWVIVVHIALLAALMAHLSSEGSTLTEGSFLGFSGIAAIAFLVGVAFRLVAAREANLVSERERAMKNLEKIAEEDRERIADELHDGIAHDLTLVLFHARALPRQPDEAARLVSLTTIEESAGHAMENIQSLIALIRDAATDTSLQRPNRYDGRITMVAQSLSTVLRDAGIPTSVSTPAATITTSPTVERLLTETAIEAVTNIIKHAPKSTSARIEILNRDVGIELIVTNTPAPAPQKSAARIGGRGLKRAEQRLRQHRGTLHAGGSGDSWILNARLPSHD